MLESTRLRAKAYAARHRDRIAAYKRQMADQAHLNRIARVFGVTKDQYFEMQSRQGGKCAICKGTDTPRRLAVDHDHVTGKVRGLLCRRCNQILGSMEDNVDWFRTIVSYLETGDTVV